MEHDQNLIRLGKAQITVLNPISGLSAKVQRLLGQSEARKQQEFSGV